MTTILKIKALDIDIRKLKKDLCIYINPISIYKKKLSSNWLVLFDFDNVDLS